MALNIYEGDNQLSQVNAFPTKFNKKSTHISQAGCEPSFDFIGLEGCERPSDILGPKNKDSRCLSLAIRNVTIN